MPLNAADLIDRKTYFVCQPTVVLKQTDTGETGINHLLLGDWLEYRGETNTHEGKTYAKVKCRGDLGWLELDEFDVERGLEVNFVDVGQGDGCHIVTPDDKVLLIDAGVSDNMNRFLSWRYNLRDRNVAGTADFDPAKPDKGPWMIDYVVMSHPDNDHYLGFKSVFENPKLQFGAAYHNGIVERPKEDEVPGVTYSWDFGGLFAANGKQYVFDYVATTAQLKAISARHPRTTKELLSTFRALLTSCPDCSVESLGVDMASLEQDVYVPEFGSDQPFSLQVLGPIREEVPFGGINRTTLRRLGSEGETKNGHSVILKGRYGKLRLLLGGDLNEPAQNFLLKSYAGTQNAPDEVHEALHTLASKRQPLEAADQQKHDALQSQLATLAERGKEVFGVDIAKACHHGSQHILDDFIRASDALATILSSGDNEPHGHPRPDALGAYGKHGYGNRPLIFSTELARSTNEFSTPVPNYLRLAAEILAIEAMTDKKEKEAAIKAVESKKDRNVAVYGMITVRALGDKVVIAQKLETPRKPSQKWDFYDLRYDDQAGRYLRHGGGGH
jgi:beta-lactamase superfamily II metal-dependent hydrolase